MQLVFRAQLTHVLEFEGTQTIGDAKQEIAALENLEVANVSLFAAGCPVDDRRLVSEFENTDIEVTVGLPGGKVHGSLARAGKVRGQTPKVDKQEKKKKKTGRARLRMLYNRRFVNTVEQFGRRRGPNSNSPN